jgi:thymidylate synthase ThyX
MISKSKIFIYDEFSPEDTAMLQALYSRSQSSVVEHVEKVKEAGSGKFMEKFYVGYGHKSIADCGSTTIFIEKASILAAKAIQDWQLYSGQESSTRYIDYSNQEFVDPCGTEASREILQKWLNFYLGNQETVIEHLKKIYPKKETEKKSIYNRAIKARSFDILRGFLPPGVTTQLSWHTNLRQACDKLSLLKHHPLMELKEIASKICMELKRKYKNSFSHSFKEEHEAYNDFLGEQFTYYSPSHFEEKITTNIKSLDRFKEVFQKRPPRVNLPAFLADLGNITFKFLLDFGSFRDLQRHRNGVCRMPLLTPEFGFNKWYLSQLPEKAREEALCLIKDQLNALSKLEVTPEVLQYYIAMGFNVPVKVTYGLPAAVYVTELRSSKTVHPTLRRVAKQMHISLLQLFPNLVLHSDLDRDNWDIRRGTQTIKKKYDIL